MALAGVMLAGSCFFLCTVRLYAQIGDSLVANVCSNSSDCYPAGLNETNVPTKYINCFNQKCVCSDCFYATNSYKSCAYQRCWEYDKTTQTCNDRRKDQRIAFILSFFLSFLGAANFYIERYDFGSTQLGLFLLMPFIILGLCCSWLGLINRVHCTYELLNRYGIHDIVVWWPFLIVSWMWILSIIMWWVADIVTFAENLRVSGDGCPLRQSI